MVHFGLKRNSTDCPDLLNKSPEIWHIKFKFDGKNHKLRETGGYPLEFLFTKSPTYTLINDMLGRRFSEYFKAKGVEKSNYKAFSAYSLNFL